MVGGVGKKTNQNNVFIILSGQQHHIYISVSQTTLNMKLFVTTLQLPGLQFYQLGNYLMKSADNPTPNGDFETFMECCNLT